MLFKDLITVYFEIYTQHTNSVGQVQILLILEEPLNVGCNQRFRNLHMHFKISRLVIKCPLK
jgi:hypothetical protein